ncbi:hypothetical protein TcCL_NonESM11504 [Trypanosoma cruzi]|nr:hypothetical protein TcCL_NonESM11504 [Trypanosoma cruzi]
MATPIVMRSPEAEMQRVMRTDLLSLLSFRGTRQQACRRCDHYDRYIRTATGQGSYCELTALRSPRPPLLSRHPTTTPALPTERIEGSTTGATDANAPSPIVPAAKFQSAPRAPLAVQGQSTCVRHGVCVHVLVLVCLSAPTLAEQLCNTRESKEKQ